MKAGFRHLVVFSVLISAVFAQTAERKNMAIYNFTGLGVNNIEAQVITDRIRVELTRLETYSIIERGLMEQILEEQVLQLSGLCDDASCLVEVGQILAVHYIVGGSVSKIGNLFTIEARIIDVESGEIVNSVVEDYSGPIENLLLQTTKIIASKLLGEISDGRPLLLSGDCDLLVKSDPPGGTIFINDKPMGDVTPYRLDGLLEGDYLVEVRKGNLTGEKTVTLEKNKIQDVLIELAVEEFTLRIYSEPSGAEVTVIPLGEKFKYGASHLNSDIFAIPAASIARNQNYFTKVMSSLTNYFEIGTINKNTPFNILVLDTTIDFRVLLKKEFYFSIIDTVHFASKKLLRLNYDLEPCGRLQIPYLGESSLFSIFLNETRVEEWPNKAIKKNSSGQFFWEIDKLEFAEYILRIELRNSTIQESRVALSEELPVQTIEYFPDIDFTR